MRHIDSKNKYYLFGNSTYYGCITFSTAHNLFYSMLDGSFEAKQYRLDRMILSDWDKDEFLEFIKISKSFESKYNNFGYIYINNYKYCLEDLEKNLDKYLNLAAIKCIIK